MGEAPDYTALTFAHFDATGERFFGQKYFFCYARTQTPTFGSDVADVGFFSPVDGPVVSEWAPGKGHGPIHAIALVVASLETDNESASRYLHPPGDIG